LRRAHSWVICRDDTGAFENHGPGLLDAADASPPTKAARSTAQGGIDSSAYREKPPEESYIVAQPTHRRPR
jgi:hypothetical protein